MNDDTAVQLARLAWRDLEGVYRDVSIRTPQNIFTLILEAIEKNPDGLQMEAWHSVKVGNGDGDMGRNYDWEQMDAQRIIDLGIKSCKTAHCFAGWGVWLTPGLRELERLDRHDSDRLFNCALIAANRRPVPLHMFLGNTPPSRILNYIKQRAIEEEGYVEPITTG